MQKQELRNTIEREREMEREAAVERMNIEQFESTLERRKMTL